MLYVIKSKAALIKISDFGAEIVSVLVDGKEKLWQNTDGSWDGHAPLLFPVCGHFGCKVNGVEYPMPPHGFAKDMTFRVKKQSAVCILFELLSSPETKEFYPYSFVYRVGYRIKGKKLSIFHEIVNPSDRPIYFACGGHESYLLENSIGNYKLIFPFTESFVHRPHNKDGFLTGAHDILGMGKELILPDNYLQNGATVILEKIKSQRLRFANTNGKPVADITFKGFHNILLWRPGNAAVICIEPWSNLPDEANAWQREFYRKSGVFEVRAGKTKRLKRTIRYY